ICFAFRHMPLTMFHPHAEGAAEAAEAASVQGRFWEMHALLYRNQNALDASALAGHAGALGLDVVRFQREMEQHTYRGRVRADQLGGHRSGVRGTPPFFIDGVRHDGPADLQEMLAAIRARPPEVPAAAITDGPNIRVPGMTLHEPGTAAP